MGPDLPPPWELREPPRKPPRKHERSPTGAADATAAQRWRDRELPSCSPSSRVPSSGMYSFAPSRAERIWPEGESLRPPGRNGGTGMTRESSRESLRQRSPYRSPSDDASRKPLLPPPPPPTTGLRSLAVPIVTSTQAPLKDANFGTVMAQKTDRDHSLGSRWKTAKWSRPSSLSLAKVEEAAAKRPAMSYPEMFPQDADDGTPRKKARLGWGQGLAKYEKQRVQGSQDSLVSGAKSGPGDSSPGVTGPEGCPSVASLFSPRCSLSPAIVDERTCASATSCQITACHHDLSGVDLECKEFAMKLDNFEVNCASSLKAFLDDLLQPEDACSGDSASTRHAAMDKLLLLKVDVSKELEKTECEIDFLEGEMKSLDSSVKSFLPPVVVAAKVSSVSSDAPMGCIQPECNSLQSQAEPENHVSSISLGKQDTAPADFKTGNSQGISSKCKHEELAQSTTIANIHGIELKEVQKDAPLEQIAETRDGDVSVSCVATSSSDRYSLVPSFLLDRTNSKLISDIMESNHQIAKSSSQAFHRALPSNPQLINILELVKVSNQMKNVKRIKEKISVCKRQLKFKEKVLTLKFMAFYQLWKKDLHLLSIKRNHTKSNKRLDASNRQSHNGFQKLRSSSRSRFALSENGPASSAEVLEVLCKLLSDSQVKIYRSNLRMPVLILDKEERKSRKFVHKNGLIEDPLSLELERSRVNPWTQEEKEHFMELFARYGKNFTKISSFLSHRTTADCIEYYYKNHKSESFCEAKKCLGITKQSKCLPASTFLVTSGRKWNCERNSTALDVLGAATVVAAKNHGSVKAKHTDNGRSVYQYRRDSKAPLGCHNSSDKVQGREICVHERESVAADVLAGVSSTPSSEGMNSCVTSSIGQAARMNFSEMDQPVLQNFDEDSCSDEDYGDLDPNDWSDNEKSNFLQALSIYGKDFAKISSYLGTKSSEQCRTFFSKARSCLDLDVVHLRNSNAALGSDDTNEGSDIDDACAADVDSTICSTQSCSKVNGDGSQPVTDANCDRGGTSVQSEVDRSSDHDTAGVIDFADSFGDKQENTLNDDKHTNEEDNPWLCDASKESNNATLSCNDTEHLQKNAEKIDSLSRTIENNANAPPVQHVNEAPVYLDTMSQSDGVIQQKDTSTKSSSDMLKRKVSAPHTVSMEIGSKNRRRASFDLGSSSSGSSVICFAQDLNSRDSVLQKGGVISGIPRPTSAPSHQQQDLLPHMVSSNPTIPLKQEMMPGSAVYDPPSICFAGSSHIVSQKQATLNFQEHAIRQHQNSATFRELYQRYLLNNAQLNQFNQPMHILKGYPLPMLPQKEIRKEDKEGSIRSSLLDNSFKPNGLPQPTHLVSSMQNGITYGSSHSIQGSRILCAGMINDPAETQTSHWSQTALPETSRQPANQPGGVKLFGKIIAQTPSSQNANTPKQENQSKPPSSKLNESSNMMMPSSMVKNGVAFSSRTGSSSLVSLGKQGTSRGIWDATRISAGFPSLSNSNCMVASYQVLGPGMPFVMSREDRPKGNVLSAGCQQPCMQQLSSDGRRHCNFTLPPSRNSAEITKDFQPSVSIEHVGANLVNNNGGFLAAGKGISDPVAALRMQYASSSSSKVSETEFWRQNCGGR